MLKNDTCNPFPHGKHPTKYSYVSLRHFFFGRGGVAYYSEEWINGLIAVNVWTFNFLAAFRELTAVFRV